jgi:hypothetical protein
LCASSKDKSASGDFLECQDWYFPEERCSLAGSPRVIYLFTLSKDSLLNSLKVDKHIAHPHTAWLVRYAGSLYSESYDSHNFFLRPTQGLQLPSCKGNSIVGLSMGLDEGRKKTKQTKLLKYYLTYTISVVCCS